MKLIDRVEKDFDPSGKPLHVANPQLSMFRILSLAQFNQLTDQQVQELHGQHHLLVTGYPPAAFEFDARGMATLAPPSRIFTIQGAFFYGTNS